MMMFFLIILAAGSETRSRVRRVARNFTEVRSVFPINPSQSLKSLSRGFYVKVSVLHDWAVAAFGCCKIGENMAFCFEKIACRKSKQISMKAFTPFLRFLYTGLLFFLCLECIPILLFQVF